MSGRWETPASWPSLVKPHTGNCGYRELLSSWWHVPKLELLQHRTVRGEQGFCCSCRPCFNECFCICYTLVGLILKLKLHTLATWCKELTHLKRPWCWERLRAGGEGDDRGWDGWIASLTQWTWVGWTPGIGDGQGGLVCCGSWGRKELDTSERLNWTEHAPGGQQRKLPTWRWEKSY